MALESSDVWRILNHTGDGTDDSREEITATSSHLGWFDDALCSRPGQTTLIAGNESCGNHAGHSGEAMFNSPFGFSFAPDGSLVVADTDNSCIKQITPNGNVVTTLATSAEGFKSPTGIVVCERTGNAYIADSGVFGIFRLNHDTGEVDMISGDMTAGHQESDGTTNTVAHWDLPFGLAMDSSGDLLVCDRSQHVIRKVQLSSGLPLNDPANTITVQQNHKFRQHITPYSHSGSGADVNINRTQTVDSEANVEVGGSRADVLIQQPTTKLIAGVPGTQGCEDGPSSEALLDTPTAIAVAPDGTIYVSDIGSGRLRQISRDYSRVLTLPGHYRGALGLDVDKHGRLYVANTDARQILRYDPHNGQVVELPTTGLVHPVALRVDSTSGVLFVADQHSFKAVKVVKSLPPTHSTLNDDMAQLLTQESPGNAAYADVTFDVHGTQLRAHCAILACRCAKIMPLIQKAAGGHTSQISSVGGGGHGGVMVPIADEGVTPKAFAAFLCFLYSDRCIVDQDTVEPLLKLSHEYGMDRLTRLVEEYVMKRVEVDNVIAHMRMAHVYGAERLKAGCIKVLIRHFNQLQAELGKSGLEAYPELLSEIIVSLPPK
ncbi:unnamed protein product [Vitrella brassicaformis CCMP3155]|uniref:BTB domain-containing protein n=1 Tax=Vitrella brassicaformis (strain CCMP3155) TaxID=1169540 RepID=A0A0G4ERJ6_VITBC|nr:unnamed protein product [Vitrella brassicaformis CCMP3155]|eukprot:CEM00654.1 unnamed protein product [Vitrella brassicaformis CCMP3155]